LPIYWSVFDIAGKQQRVTELEKRASSPDFWNDPETAQAEMRQLTALRDEINHWSELQKRSHDALELLELAQLEAEEATLGNDVPLRNGASDSALIDDVLAETGRLEAELEQREFTLLLSGRHDRGDAILAIHAGAGGVDAQDWTEMLMRMYLRWAEQHAYKSSILDQMDGDEAGIKSVTVAIEGEYAYGYLRAERGVHRLVRLSPFDAAHRRHTSFALVELWPDIGESSEVVIQPDDLKIETFRASSAGGQHVQKNETAVRITHLPTGLVVSCQNERSQNQNRENALKVLRARLAEIEERRRRQELAELKGVHVSAEWGSQIRSYVLHPYQMVKDHRTEHETGNTAAVLDGQLDTFMEAYLRSTIGG
jgi:peptide chain release factor 2